MIVRPWEGREPRLGARVFVALCLALTIQHFRPERVAAAISASAASLALGNIVGVTLGPLVADQFSWRWSFVGVAVSAGLALARTALAPTAVFGRTPPAHFSRAVSSNLWSLWRPRKRG